MATGTLSIKLRCASWQQLATIYKRDLSKGTMFLRAAQPPPLGSLIRIDLTLPSASVIELSGAVERHLSDQRGSGVELRLAPIPAGSIWLIESALASEQRKSTPPRGVAITPSGPVASVGDGAEVAGAETELARALHSEVESLRKLNPFLVLGVGYEAGDAEVRKAFGELTKRYHPDRFARYEASELRLVASEIFILIRDAYRRLCDEDGRAQALASLGRSRTPVPIPRMEARPRTAQIPKLPARPPPPPPELDPQALEALIDAGRLDEALSGYKALAKKHPQDRTLRAGIELCEGLLALGLRDRHESARRFETALEIDPSNERAARELADMRRQATNERKGLLSRLMGKPESKET